MSAPSGASMSPWSGSRNDHVAHTHRITHPHTRICIRTYIPVGLPHVHPEVCKNMMTDIHTATVSHTRFKGQ